MNATDAISQHKKSSFMLVFDTVIFEDGCYTMLEYVPFPIIKSDQVRPVLYIVIINNRNPVSETPIRLL